LMNSQKWAAAKSTSVKLQIWYATLYSSRIEMIKIVERKGGC
jgi:hypothetical protein